VEVSTQKSRQFITDECNHEIAWRVACRIGIGIVVSLEDSEDHHGASTRRNTAGCRVYSLLRRSAAVKVVTLFHFFDQTDAVQVGVKRHLRATESEIATSAQFISILLDAATDKMPFVRSYRLHASSASWSMTFKPVVKLLLSLVHDSA